MLKIDNVLSADQRRECRDLLAQGPWVDGNETSGHQSRLSKRNEQIAQGSETAQRAGQIVMAALGQAPLFVAAALPRKVYMPMFNRYGEGETFGNHVDSAIRQVRGSDERVRTDLSCTLFLSEPEEYDGGELVVEDLFGEHRVKLPAGSLVLYPSSSLHRVEPVMRGARLACVFWLQSMVRDNQEREHLFRLDSTIQKLSGDRGPQDEAVVELTSLYHNLLRRWADV